MWNGAARLKNHTDEQLRHLDICKESIESPWKFVNCSFDWMLISLSLTNEDENDNDILRKISPQSWERDLERWDLYFQLIKTHWRFLRELGPWFTDSIIAVEANTWKHEKKKKKGRVKTAKLVVFNLKFQLRWARRQGPKQNTRLLVDKTHTHLHSHSRI